MVCVSPEAGRGRLQFCYDVPTEIHLRLTAQNYVSNSVAGPTQRHQTPPTGLESCQCISFLEIREIWATTISPSLLLSLHQSQSCQLWDRLKSKSKFEWLASRLCLSQTGDEVPPGGDNHWWLSTDLERHNITTINIGLLQICPDLDSFSTNIEIELNLMILTGN